MIDLEQKPDMDALLSIEQAARRLGGLSKFTINAWLSQGRLQRTKVGSRTMIRESELRRVIEDGGKSPSRRAIQPKKTTAPDEGSGAVRGRGSRLTGSRARNRKDRSTAKIRSEFREGATPMVPPQH